MSVIYPPESEYAKESVKWEAQGSPMGPGLRPYQFRPYPMMMHKAGRPENGMGPHVIVDKMIVDSELGEEAARHQGFRPTPLDAIKALDEQNLEFAKLAAEINYEVKNKLSEKAGAEVTAAQAAHHGHMPVMPETPIKPKRGRKAKVKE